MGMRRPLGWLCGKVKTPKASDVPISEINLPELLLLHWAPLAISQKKYGLEQKT